MPETFDMGHVSQLKSNGMYIYIGVYLDHGRKFTYSFYEES